MILLTFGHATRSATVRNQMVIDKNFPTRGNTFFIILKNLPKFEYREFVSAIYAKKVRPFLFNFYLRKIYMQGLTDS